MSEELARLFHDTYERLAPSFGYETRQDTKQFDPTSPNGKLMIAVCSEVASALRPSPPKTAEGENESEELEKHVATCPQCSGPDDGCEEGQRLEEATLTAPRRTAEGKWSKELDCDGEWNLLLDNKSIAICMDEPSADKFLAALADLRAQNEALRREVEKFREAYIKFVEDTRAAAYFGVGNDHVGYGKNQNEIIAQVERLKRAEQRLAEKERAAGNNT